MPSLFFKFRHDAMAMLYFYHHNQGLQMTACTSLYLSTPNANYVYLHASLHL